MEYFWDILFFGLQWYGLFLINKKLWEKYAWTSFIPFVHMYAITTAAWKNIKWLIVLLLSWLLALLSIFWWVFVALLWLDSTAMIPLLSLSWVFIIVYVLIYLHFLDQISRRTWGWFLRALGFLILPFIVFPLVGHQFDPKNNTPKEKQETVKL
jgi:multidrug efflux pump subunit AcrB